MRYYMHVSVRFRIFGSQIGFGDVETGRKRQAQQELENVSHYPWQLISVLLSFTTAIGPAKRSPHSQSQSQMLLQFLPLISLVVAECEAH